MTRAQDGGKVVILTHRPPFMTRAQDGGKVVILTHRPPYAPGAHFSWRLSRPQVHCAIGRIMSMKNSNDTRRALLSSSWLRTFEIMHRKRFDMRYCLFWDVTQRWLVVSYRRFGTTYRSHLHGRSIQARPLKMGQKGCPETSVTGYQ